MASDATAPAAQGAPPTIAEASAACDRVQANSAVPISCSTDYIDDVPSMIVGFRTSEEARAWLKPFAEQVGGPFCDAANRNGREARVYMTVGVGAQQQARRYSCELGKWSTWFSTTPPEAATAENTSPAAPATLADAIASCKALQDDRSVPMTCQARYIGDVPALIVGFPTQDEAKTYMDQVAARLGEPFCAAANAANRRAAFIVTLGQERARHYDCEQKRWSDWFELPQQSSDNRARNRL